MTTPLDDFVCFAMYTASHATTQAYREVLRPWKLTYPQYLALVVLATGERTVSSLGDDLGLDSGTLSPMLRRLETRGLVQRQRDDADERVVRVSLTHADVMDAVGCLVPAFQQGGDLGALVRQLAAITESMRTLAGELRTAG